MPGWAGTTLADRRAVRRAQLFDAGLELLGGGEPAAVSVRAVCRRAKLTERYFYESFADREELVLAVYELVGAQAQRVLVDAVRSAATATGRAEAAVEAFVELIVDDPRKGRMLLLAPMTDPALSHRGGGLLPAFAALVREQLSGGADDLDRQMIAIGLVGALSHVFVAYLEGSLAASRERLVAHCVRLVMSADAAR
jgi:AcrR family transcriptional regulator